VGDDYRLAVITETLQTLFPNDKQKYKQSNRGKRYQVHGLCQVMQDSIWIDGICRSMTRVCKKLWTIDQSYQDNQSEFESIHFKKSF